MLEVKVTIHVPELSEAVNRLADALSGRSDACTIIPHEEPAPVKNTAPEAPVTAQTLPNTPAIPVTAPETPSATASPVPPVASEPVQAVPTAPEVPAVPPVSPVSEAPASTAPAPTLDKLSAAGAALMTEGKMAELIKLLGTFNVRALTELSEDQYAAFADGLRGLGAKL